MGWTFFVPPAPVRSAHDLCALVDSELGREHIVASAMVGHVYYGAYRGRHGNVIGVVVLTERSGAQVGMKIMGEDMGPHYYDCPASVFRHLTPLDKWPEGTTAFAPGWRLEVSRRLDKRVTA